MKIKASTLFVFSVSSIPAALIARSALMYPLLILFRSTDAIPFARLLSPIVIAFGIATFFFYLVSLIRKEAGIDQKEVKRAAILASIYWGIPALFSPIIFVASFMLFDAPGSSTSILTNLLFYSALLFIPLSALSLILVLRRYRSGKYRLACISAMIPFIPISAIIACIALMSIICGGRTSC